MPDPLLDSAQNGTSVAQATWQLPTLSVPGDNVQLIAFVQNSPGRDLVLPAGWSIREQIDAPVANNTYFLIDRSVPVADPPYEDTLETVIADDILWSAAQMAFRQTASNPANSGSAADEVGCVNRPSLAIDLGAPATAGNLLIAYATRIDCGPGTGSEAYEWPAGWTELENLPSQSSFIGIASVAYKVAAGGETGVTVVADYSNVWAMIGIVAEYAVDPDPEPVNCRPMLFDVYELGTGSGVPPISFLETLCTATDQLATFEELGAGFGAFKINRYSAEATEAILGRGDDDTRLVKVRIPAISPTPIGAFWIESGDFRILSGNDEEGGEDLKFEGRGALAYLARAIMAPRSYLTDPVLVQPHDRLWRFQRPDIAGSLAYLASNRNGGGSLVDSWQLPAVAPDGDDVLLLAFLQQRPPSVITPPAGWTNRISVDTSLGGTELRYQLADRVVAVGAPPYDDTFDSADPARWTAAQLAFRSTGAPTGVDGSEHQAESSTTAVISATLSGATTAGNILVAYATETSASAAGTPQVPRYEWPSGWTQLIVIPNGNPYTGYAAVAYKVADGTETEVTVTIRDDTELTSSSLLVAEYPILYSPLKAGEILYLVCAELLEPARPSQPVPALSLDFTFELDSNGDPWDETPATAGFTARVGENVLEVVTRLLATGSIVVVMGHDLVLHAYNRSTYGRDLTGGAFGAGVVRFVAGVGIAESLTRQREHERAATDAWAIGDGDTFALATAPDASSRVPREIAVDLRTTDGAALEGAAETELTFREEQAERINLATVVGETPLTGQYLPGEAGTDGHYWTGDTIRLHTGTSEFDYDEADERVAVISIAEPTGDDAAVDEVTDLEIAVRLVSNMLPTGSPPSIGGSGSAGVVAGGVSDHGELTGLEDDDHPQYLLRSEHTESGTSETPFGHGPMGAAETIAVGDGTWHTGTLDASCTITVSGFTLDEGVIVIVKITQDGTGGRAITWDPDVVFAGDDQPAQGAGEVTWFALWSDEGDATIYGSIIGGGAAVEALDDLSDVVITSPAAAQRLRFDGTNWVNSSLKWSPTTTFDGTDWLLVVDGDGNPVLTEV